MQVRVREDRYRQRSDSLEFRLVRARLRALSGSSVDAQRTLRSTFEGQIRDRTTVDDLAAWFGLAVLTLEQRDFPAFDRALAETRARATAGHPFIERLAADARLRQGDAAGALSLARAASARWVSSRALVHLQAQALLALGEAARAQEFLNDQLLLYRSDATLWRLLSQAWQALRQPAQAHRAAAEDYALTGSWLAAIEQLRLALRAGGLDFYTASLVDARIKDLQAEYTRDQQDRKGGR
jgi:predicted Zn-dependent protease